MEHNTSSMEAATRERYAQAAGRVEVSLCCASGNYDSRYLKAIPQTVLDVDYGCGDPSKWVEPGETVIDLGSGSGKICFIAAQIVGLEGRVIGVDFNPPMLQLSREAKEEFVDRVGFDNVEFRYGRIQDLALDLDALDAWLADHPVTDASSYLAMNEAAQRLRAESPLIPDASIDVIISNCVLNLVNGEEKLKLFSEMHRVLRSGGRCVISDIVSDEVVPVHMQADPELWSGCISGTFVEDAFLKAFERAGFYGIEIVERGSDPWQVVEGIEFRSVTVRAYKGNDGPCLDRKQAVIYRGPWKAVIDDNRRTLRRGEAMAVCGKTFEKYTSKPYADCISAVPPRVEVPVSEAQPLDCSSDARRLATETKGPNFRATHVAEGACCSEGGACC